MKPAPVFLALLLGVAAILPAGCGTTTSVGHVRERPASSLQSAPSDRQLPAVSSSQRPDAANFPPVASSNSEPSPRESEQPDPESPTIVMKPFEVKEKSPNLSFGMSLSVWSNSITRKVTAIYVTRVKPESDAEKAGIKLFTRITKIDGQPVEGMAASFKYGTELNRAFINRKPGDKLTLEVTDEGSRESRTVRLVDRSMPWTRPDFLPSYIR